MTIYDGTAEVGPVPTITQIYAYDRLRVITDAQHFIVPVILLLAAVFVWLSLRLVFGGSAGRLRTLIGLWFEAKERELRKRAGKQEPP